jgi:putative transposase
MCQVLLTISKRIEEYIRNQLQDDIANDQLSLFESVDPFTGKKNSKK